METVPAVEVVCWYCERAQTCPVVDDEVIRPSRWVYPNGNEPLRGVCPECQDQ